MVYSKGSKLTGVCEEDSKKYIISYVYIRMLIYQCDKVFIIVLLLFRTFHFENIILFILIIFDVPNSLLLFLVFKKVIYHVRS